MNKTIISVLVILFFLILPGSISAHCDGVDGPVIQAAMKSLETEDVSHVLIWIKKEDEKKIRNVFSKTLNVRKLSPEAKEVADHHFFETVVRIHREGEGEPFTGIKAAGRDLGPVIPAADRSVESGSLDEVKEIISAKLMKGLEEKFNNLQDKKRFEYDETEKGREFVEAYVEYLHFAENLYKAADFSPHQQHKTIKNEDEHHH
jgi:hypothetical protein